MPLTVGGGVRTIEDIRKLLLAGADKVSINTAAVARPEFVREAAEKFGSQCIVAAVDAKAVAPGKWGVFTHGGRRPAEEFGIIGAIVGRALYDGRVTVPDAIRVLKGE